MSETSSDPRFALAARLLAEGKANQAVEMLFRAWSAEPDNLDLAVSYASLLARVERVDEAIDLFATLADESPADARIWNNWGYLLLTRGEPEAAAEKLGEALRLEPGDFEAMVNLGIALDRLGKVEESLVHYRRAREAAPDSPVLYNNMGAALWRAGRAEEALEAFRQALRLNPRDASAANNMGVIKMEGGKFAEAEGYFRQALEMDPESRAAAGNLLAAAKHRKEADKEAGTAGKTEKCQKPPSSSLF